jgi:hypothetical protein
LSIFSTAVAPLAHAEIVPSSVAKMNRAAALDATMKSFVLVLKTIPVGAPGGVPPVGGGTVTTNVCGVPLPL